jgi:hypothetical protein
LKRAAFTLKTEVDRLTAEYANTIKILEEIGLNAEKGESFSTIQGAIKILRVELDRELDINEMKKFRSEVVLLDPDEELERVSAENASRRASQRMQPGIRRGELQETGIPFTGSVPENGAVTGRIGVPRDSGIADSYAAPQARRPMVREAAPERIQIKLSSMKIEKVPSGRHSDADSRDRPDAASEPDPGTDELMKCRNCGTMISRKSIVCVSCGEFLR